MFDQLSAWEQGQAIYLVLLLLLIVVGSVSLRGLGARRLLSLVAAWIMIFAVALVAATYRSDVRSLYERVVGEVDPARAVATSDGVRIRARDDGHFWVRAQVNAVPVLFLVDTGSSDIVLTDDTARRIGIDTERLAFDRMAMTANGPVRGASVKLESLVIGPIVRRDVPASVTEGALDIDLLGMSYLRSLAGWRVEGDTLILHP